MSPHTFAVIWFWLSSMACVYILAVAFGVGRRR